MVGPDWRIGAWTFFSIPAGTAGWGCLILFGAPDDGADAIRLVIVMIGAVIAVLTMAFYLCTACTDPGIVFRHLAPTPRPQQQQQQQQQQLGGGARSAEMASAGAGTPVPTGGAGFGTGGATVAVAAGAGEKEGKAVAGWSSEDIEAQQMLDILTEDYRDGVLSRTEAAAAPALAAADTEASAAGAVYSGNGNSGNGEALAGLHPEECAAAADSGSSAVADMRNVPPRDGDESSQGTLSPPPRPALATVQQQQQQQQVGAGFVVGGGRGGGGDAATVCGRCQIERPPGAVHCIRCGVCVQKLDHHCPFMGQCVGRKTLVPFYLFVVSVWSLIIYVLLAVAYLVVAVIASGL
eukprot:g12480.t1